VRTTFPVNLQGRHRMVVIRQEDGGVFLMALGEGLRNVLPVAKVNQPVVMERIILGEEEGIREVLAIRP
jgi:hypothetical protein